VPGANKGKERVAEVMKNGVFPEARPAQERKDRSGRKDYSPTLPMGKRKKKEFPSTIKEKKPSEKTFFRNTSEWNVSAKIFLQRKRKGKNHPAVK